jgi:ubiquitin-protein ligase
MDPENYPDVPPKVRFTTPLFHPWIDPLTGELEWLKNLIKDWEPQKTMIWQLLNAIKKAVLQVEELTYKDSIVKNQEAYQMYFKHTKHSKSQKGGV